MRPEPRIREYRAEDAAAVADLLAPLVPADEPITAAGMAHWLDTMRPEEGKLWVAECGGEIVGWAESTLHFSAVDRDVERVWAAVRPDQRRRGLGARLYRMAEERALSREPRMLRSWAMSDDAEGVGFLRSRGFDVRRTSKMWALDPATVDLSDLSRREVDAAAAGYRLAPLRDLLHRPEDLYRAFHAAERDMPNDLEVGGVTFEEWRRLVLGGPELDLDGSFVALGGDEPVALAWLAVDRERGLAGNAITGTVPAHRHRGLARLVKLATVRWAVAHGIRRIASSNDSTNRDMLALNEHLGYQPMPDFLIFGKTLR
ncbi:MAG TPA: GNAT family N-acetyltransferase [Candidatus Dormibacteraeota bacterium]|nr:GNAT family N-acetyltransferase [Candidatus Dormibacteraeota bacterium]